MLTTFQAHPDCLSDLLNLSPISTLPPVLNQIRLKCAAATSGQGWRDNTVSNPLAHAQHPQAMGLEAREVQGVKREERYAPTGALGTVMFSPHLRSWECLGICLRGERKQTPWTSEALLTFFVTEGCFARPRGPKETWVQRIGKEMAIIGQDSPPGFS